MKAPSTIGMLTGAEGLTDGASSLRARSNPR
jgi:hypothetical protein